MWLLLVAKCFLEAGRKLRLVSDFTHDILLQNFKLGVISIAGLHFTRGDWCNTVIPGMYCLARQENTAAYLPMIQALKHEFFGRFEFVLEDVVKTVFTDGHDACKIALRIELPRSTHILCSQRTRELTKEELEVEFKW